MCANNVAVRLRACAFVSTEHVCVCVHFWIFAQGALVWNPMDVVKQKQQALVGRTYGPVEGLRRVYAEGARDARTHMHKECARTHLF